MTILKKLLKFFIFRNTSKLGNSFVLLTNKSLIMKKLFAVLVLVMTVLAVNAQRTPVKTADLNKAIIDNVAKDYAGFTIKEATKVETNMVVTYEVVVVKGTATDTLLYDKDGKFIKKLVKQEGTTTKPAVKKEPAKTPVKK